MPFTKELSAEWSHRILAIIRCRIFCLPVYCPRKWRRRNRELQFCLLCCVGIKIVKKVTGFYRLRSLNCYICNQTVKRKRRDNFNDIIFFRETTILFPWKKCPCWQEKHVTYYHNTREMTLVVKCFAKYSLTAMPLPLPLAPTGCTFSRGHSKCHRTECHYILLHNCVERSKP
jgi:hypothetical protein